MDERRDSEFIHDICEAIGRIRRYAARLTLRGFFKDAKTQDAIARNLEILAEEAKGLSSNLRKKHKRDQREEHCRDR